MTHLELQRVFREALADVQKIAGRGLVDGWPALPGRDQLLTNCVGVTLSWRLLPPALSAAKNVYLYSTPHRNKRGSHHAWLPADVKKALGHRLRTSEFLTDVFIESWAVRDDRAELVAEIEAYPHHEPLYSEKSDYYWDFYKLLYVMAKRRLFVACCRPHNLDELERILKRAYADRVTRLASDDELYVVLLPNSRRVAAWDQVRLGLNDGQRLVFQTVSVAGSDGLANVG